MSEAPEVSVIIVSYNTRALLADCLASLSLELAGVAAEVIVVDNNSTDDSAAMVRERFPTVRLIANTENRGFAGANNQGYALSTAPYVLLLNPDTVVRSGAVRSMLSFMAEHGDVGVVACKLLNPDGTIQRSIRDFPSVLRNLGEILGRSTYKSLRFHQTTAATDIDDAIGACLMVKREALGGQPLFDERFFLYSEDKDLCWRVRRAGWRVVFVPWAEVVHFGGGSARQASRQSYLQLQKSQLLFYWKHYPPVQAKLLGLTWFALILSRYLLVAAASVLSPRRRPELSHARRLFGEAAKWLRANFWRPPAEVHD